MHSKPSLPIPGDALSQPPASVTDARAAIATWTDLSATRQRDLSFDLGIVAKWAGLPPGNVLLAPAFLRQHVLEFPQAPPRTSTGRKANVRASLAYVLNRLGAMGPDIGAAPSTPAWATLLCLLEPRGRYGMTKFAAYCSRLGIAPEAVRAETLMDFCEELTARTLGRAPRKRIGEVRTRWNHACRTIPGWPGQPLAELGQANAFILPPSAFPAAFRDKVAAMWDAMTDIIPDESLCDEAEFPDDLDVPRKRLKPIRASTAELRKGHCRWAASALVATGMPIADLTDPVLLVTPVTRVRDILRFLHQRAGGKPSAAGMHAAEVLLIIAKYHARLPQKDLDRIRMWSRTVKLVYDGMTAKNEKAVRAILTPDWEIIFRALPDTLMRTARALRVKSPGQAATEAFRSVAIQLGSLHATLRLADMCKLRLDQHLQRADPKHGLITYIEVPAADTKNTRKVLVPVSKTTATLLQEWIDDFRPLIAAPDCLYLFPGHGTGSRHITPQSLRDAVKTVTKRDVGVALSPHQFRHLAARCLLDAYPRDFEMVRQYLNHKDVKTTKRSYCREGEEAQEIFDDLITVRRNSLGRKSTGSKPRSPHHGPRRGRR